MFDAHWIAADATDADAGEKPLPLFRRGFDLPGNVKRAVLYASGLGQDEVRINGLKVGSDELTPGWSDYRKTVYYDGYDVTRSACRRKRRGRDAGQRNVSRAENAREVHEIHRQQRPANVPCAAPGRTCRWDTRRGCERWVLEDRARPDYLLLDLRWRGLRCSPSAGRRDRAGFDDSMWKAVVVSAGPGGILRPDAADPIRVMHTYLPLKARQLKPGVLVYDLGQNFAGWPQITVGARGRDVKLVPGELLDKDGSVSQRSSGGLQWFSYTLRGAGGENWHPRFSYYGFRYVQVEGACRRARPGAG